MEIERKYQVMRMPDLANAQVREIEQGYLCKNPVVRIRKSNEQYYLTYKGKLRSQAGQEATHVCEEVEVPLTRKAYLHLCGKTDDNLITKTRYVLQLSDGHKAELDVFHGKLQGLVFVEVEFADLEDADRFEPPAWFGENVSGDKRYTNSFLSLQEDLSVFSTLSE